MRGLLTALREADVRFVLTGSLAAGAYGIAIEPRDLDIAPDTAADNLERLATVLDRIGAKPRYDPDWPESPSPEECERWRPDPPTEKHFDHLMDTSLGRLDIILWRSGRYEELIGRAQLLEVEGLRIPVAHPRDLIAWARPHREKHRIRIPFLEDAARRLEE